MKPSLIPQLAESVNPARLPYYCEHAGWATSQKADGHRRLIVVDEGVVTPLNRKGEVTTLPVPATREFERISRGHFVFDGELLGNDLELFDMPVAGNLITPASPYGDRRRTLAAVFDTWEPSRAVRLLPVGWTHKEKVAMVERLILNHSEGVMLNHVAGAYTSGRRSNRLLKAKFWNDIDCVVTGLHRNGKDNLVVSVYDDTGELVKPGWEVTALAGDGPTLAEGDVCTVKYLYAIKGSNRLVQPTSPRLRTDKAPEECLLSQLHFTSKEIVRDDT